jgi:hypothetical protein
VDEYRLWMLPAAMGQGAPLFTELARPATLSLVKTTAFPSGILELRYEPATLRVMRSTTVSARRPGARSRVVTGSPAGLAHLIGRLRDRSAAARPATQPDLPCRPAPPAR